MPEGKVEFEVIAPIEQVWSFLSDLRKVGPCVPGVENVEVLDEKRARWDLKVKIGPLSQTIRVLTETLEQIPLRRGRFRGEAENMDMIGTIELAPAREATKVVYTMSVTAKGPLSRIMDNFMRTRLKSQTEEFAANVKRALES
jgi:carbon monoxide dehydrogenase subunit G